MVFIGQASVLTASLFQRVSRLLLAAVALSAPGLAVAAPPADAPWDRLWQVQGDRPPHQENVFRGGNDMPEGPTIVLTEEESRWMRAAWAYFGGATAAPPPAPLEPAPAGDGAAAPPPPHLLVASRSGTTVATPWSIADQIAALLIARRLDDVDARTFDQRFTRLVSFLNQMTLTPDGMPNRFYDISSGEALDGNLQPGLAGWSAVDTGRLLLWLRIAAEEHPQFEPFLRRAVARWSVCSVISDRGQLQLGTIGADGTQLNPETGRGYDAYAAQGYRAWGLEMPIPALAEDYPFQTDIGGVRFAVSEDTVNQAPIMTTPPAYIGIELGFEPLGARPDEVAGGRSAAEAMTAVAEAQAARFTETGSPTARADFRRTDDPTTILGTVLAQGYP